MWVRALKATGRSTLWHRGDLKQNRITLQGNLALVMRGLYFMYISSMYNFFNIIIH